MSRPLSQPEAEDRGEAPFSETPKTEKSGVRPGIDGFVRRYVAAANEVRILVQGVRTPDMDIHTEERFDPYDSISEEHIRAKLAAVPEGECKADALLELIDEVFEMDQRRGRGENP